MTYDVKNIDPKHAKLLLRNISHRLDEIYIWILENCDDASDIPTEYKDSIPYLARTITRASQIMEVTEVLGTRKDL